MFTERKDDSRGWDAPFMKKQKQFFKRFSFQYIQGHHYKRSQFDNYEMENTILVVLVSNTAQIAS